jgi:hypothetical protein
MKLIRILKAVAASFADPSYRNRMKDTVQTTPSQQHRSNDIVQMTPFDSGQRLGCPLSA